MNILSNIAEALDQSKIRFKIPGADCRLAVRSFSITERISDCFTLSVNLAGTDEIKEPEKILEQEAILTVSGESGDRHFHGIINNFVLSGSNGRFYLYEARVVPSLWFLTLNQDCRVFQEMTVPDIVKEILEENRLDSEKFQFWLMGKHEPRRYCVQYRETDLAFISRILEEEGIYYFFEHSENNHLLVFADSTMAYKPVDGDAVIEYRSGGGMVATEETIFSLALAQTVSSDLIVQTAHNFKQPSMWQETKAESTTNTKYEIYDFPHNYGYPEDGHRLAKQRLEEHKMLEQVASGSGNCARLGPCRIFTLSGHDYSCLDKEYVLIDVHHSGEQTHVLGEQTGIGGDFTYSNSFTVVPSSVTIRPGKSIDKPVIYGLQSAIVVGPENEEIYVDEFGRVKVQFHWDRLGKRDEKSSCWLRCAQSWGGGGWGAMFIPRIGDEVLVSFMEGDPDWPIITGSVYNGRHTPLYDLPANKTRSTIKTRSYPNSNGYNELRFEDKAGQEEVYLQGEKDWNILVKNDKGQTIGHDETLSVANNRTKSVGVNQSESIGVNKTISVGANHSESIGSNMTLNVGANKFDTTAINVAETIGAAKELTIGGLYQISVGGAMNETVAGAKAEEVMGIKAVLVGAHMTEKVIGNRTSDTDKTHTIKANKVSIVAQKEISLTTGSASIVMKENGDITVKGGEIQVKGSGDVIVKGQKISSN